MIGVDIKVKSDVNALKRELIAVNPNERIRLYVANGTHTNEHDGTSMSMKELAEQLIVGAFGMPARPFFTDFLREEHKFVAETLKAAIRIIPKSNGQIKNRMYVDMESAADKILNRLRAWLMEGDYYRAVAPNAKMTIDIKGDDTPLIDSTQLIRHLEAKVVYKSKKAVPL